MRYFYLTTIVGIILSFEAFAGGPQCYMHGIMRPKSGAKAELTDMLRLHFEAKDKTHCLQLLNSYCRYNVKDEGYSPRDLEAYFKPDVDKDEKLNYKFTEACKVIPEED